MKLFCAPAAAAVADAAGAVESRDLGAAGRGEQDAGAAGLRQLLGELLLRFLPTRRHCIRVWACAIKC